MVKLKLSKKRSFVGAMTVLIVLGAIVGVTSIVTEINQLHRNVHDLQNTVAQQDKQLKAARGDIMSINSNNGTALQVCLDNAAKTYSNSLKSKDSITHKADGTDEHIMDYTSWQSINDKLTTDRSSCNSKYKNAN